MELESGNRMNKNITESDVDVYKIEADFAQDVWLESEKCTQ